jgi:hypothetical protein
MDETPLPTAITKAVVALWRIPPPGPNNLLSAQSFVRLRDACDSLYPTSKDAFGFALANALRGRSACHVSLCGRTLILQCPRKSQPQNWMRVFGGRMDCACTFVR